MFRFAQPEYLWLLCFVAGAVAIIPLLELARRKSLARFGNPQLLRELMPDFSKARVRLKTVMYLTALTLVIFAAARPQFGSKLCEEKSAGIELMLVVDVSNSMLAEDFSPSRLDRTRYAIDRLFASLNQDRVGLVVFAGEAKVQLPITTDYRMARSFSKKISTSLVSVQGTDLAKAIDLASLSFSSEGERSRAMIIITDGESHNGGVVEAAQRAADRGIRLFTLGIGTPEGAPIQIGGEFIRDEKGDMVVSRLDEESLQQIATIGNGGYIRASNQTFGLDEIVDTINKMEKSEGTELRFEEYNEQYQALLGVALVLLVLEQLLLARRNPHLRRFNIFEKEA